MKRYRGCYIDGTVFKSKSDIDAFLEKKSVEAYKTAIWLFCKNRDMESSIYADEKAEHLVNQFGYTWEQIEAIEIEAMQAN